MAQQFRPSVAAYDNTGHHDAGRPALRDFGSQSCLGRTCLQWAQDGELTALDLQLVLERLCEADAAARPLLPLRRHAHRG